MATVGNFRELLKPLIIYSKVIGVEIWTAPGKFLPASCCLSFLMTMYLIGTACTVFKYRADPMHAMKVLITLGTALQLYAKFFVGLTKGHDIKLLTEKIELDVLERYQNGTKEEIAVLDRAGRLLWMTFRTLRLLMLCPVVAFALYPLFAYFTTGMVVPLLLYELPFYDFSTTMGYIVNMLFQLNMLVYGVMGVILSDFLYIMFAMFAITAANIFVVHLAELETMLNDPMRDNTNRPEIREIWVQCMYDHQLTTSLLNAAEDVFGLVCLVQVAMGVFTLCDCMLLTVLVMPVIQWLTRLIVFRVEVLLCVARHSYRLDHQTRPLILY